MTVLSVSANHKIAPSTVCVEKSAVMIVAVTQEHTALTGNITAVLDLLCYLQYSNYGTENMKYGTNFCGLFVLLNRILMKELRKTTTIDLGQEYRNS